jgi:hypothetical protein
MRSRSLWYEVRCTLQGSGSGWIATTPSNMDVFNQTLYTLADFTGRGA